MLSNSDGNRGLLACFRIFIDDDVTAAELYVAVLCVGCTMSGRYTLLNAECGILKRCILRNLNCRKCSC